MGTLIVTCNKCNKKVAVESYLKMISTTLFVGQCPICENDVDVHVYQPKLKAHASALATTKPTRKSIEDRVATNDVQEYWLIEYIEAHYKRLGITDLRGHFKIGPDFHFLINRQWRVAEVEIECKNYLQHQHHTNAKWDDCEILVVLSEEEPNKDMRKLLPRRIIHVDRGHFTKFFRRAAKLYAIEKEKHPTHPQCVRNPGEGPPFLEMWGYDDGLPEAERFDPYR